MVQEAANSFSVRTFCEKHRLLPKAFLLPNGDIVQELSGRVDKHSDFSVICLERHKGPSKRQDVFDPFMIQEAFPTLTETASAIRVA